MRLSSPNASVFCPDDRTVAEAFESTRWLGVVAHADDLEIAAIHGILEAFAGDVPGFSGVVICDGVGAPRPSAFRGSSDEDYRRARQREQEQAATLGRYSSVVCLAHPSSSVRNRNTEVAADLDQILTRMSPDVVYTHNPVDAHDTHVAVVLELLAALKRQSNERRPHRVLGCEVWRDLDWLPDSRRVALDVGRHEDLQAQLIQAFPSQTAGKRYDRAVLGRRQANATFRRADRADETTGLVFAVDLSPLLDVPAPSLEQFALELLESFRRDVEQRFQRLRSASD